MEKENKKNIRSYSHFRKIIICFMIMIFMAFFCAGLFYFQYQSLANVASRAQLDLVSGETKNANFYLISNELFFAIEGIAFLLFLSLIGFCFYLVNAQLLKPLDSLRRQISQLKLTDLNYKIDLGKDSGLKYLADFFNARSGHFQEISANLENSIKQRTGDLDKVIATLWKKNMEMKDSETAMTNLLEDARLLEEQLKQEKDRMSTIIGCMGEGLIATDIAGVITFVNPGAERMLKIPRENFIGKKVDEVMPLYIGKECEKLVPFEERPIMKVIKTGKAITTILLDEYYYLTKQGKTIAVIISSSPLLIDNKIVGAVATFRDVTVEKRLDEAKNGFISIASHQLRTPLTSMRWFSEMLISGDAGAINKEQKKFLQRVYEGTERMIRLVDLLLQIARVEAGRVKIEPIFIDFKKVIQGVSITLRSSIEAKGQIIKTEFKPDNFPTIPMDQEVVWQVFQNLMSNASRYAPEKGVIMITAEKKGKMAEFSISDKGIGIPKDVQDRVFNKFFRAENAMKLVPEGSGLGLSLVKTLVEGWGGEIWFKSEKGKGTTFYFTIPLAGMKPKEGDVRLTV